MPAHGVVARSRRTGSASRSPWTWSGRPRSARVEERGQHAAVVEAHPRTVRVEDPDDLRAQAVHLAVGHRDGLGEALRLVVHAARPDGIHVAPVGLGLRVDLRVAVDLAGAGAAGRRRPWRGPDPARCGFRARRPSGSGSGSSR